MNRFTPLCKSRISKNALSFLIIFLLYFHSNLSAQTYPAYTATVFDTSYAGYYFLVPIQVGGGASAYNPTHLILDKNGKVVYTKEFVTGINTGDFKLQKNGLISYGYGNKFYMMDSTFTVIDSVRCKAGIVPDNHDMQILPNGHFLLMGIKNVTMDLSSYHLFNNNGTAGSATATVKCGVVQEQDANKNVVFEWNSKDYFSFADVDSTRLTNPAVVDWTHFNAVELDTDGNILISSRHFNEVTKINRTTGAIMWRLGGKANQFTFTNDAEMFVGQHDIRRLANGNITIFDNGAAVPFHKASGKEYQLDEVNLTATLVWSYANDTLDFSSAIGNAHRASNGNTLVNFGMMNSSKIVLDVVKQNGEKVFELFFNDTLRTYRAFNYPNLPWNLNRPTITCVQNGAQYYLDAGSGYASYKWSNGATTQTIPISSTGSYSIFVPKGSGGFISSEEFKVTNMNDPCNNLTAVATEKNNSEITFYPNPITDKIKFSAELKNANYQLINAIGALVWQGKDVEQKDFSYLKSGLYLLRVQTQNKEQVIRFVKE